MGRITSFVLTTTALFVTLSLAALWLLFLFPVTFYRTTRQIESSGPARPQIPVITGKAGQVSIESLFQIRSDGVLLAVAYPTFGELRRAPSIVIPSDTGFLDRRAAALACEKNQTAGTDQDVCRIEPTFSKDATRRGYGRLGDRNPENAILVFPSGKPRALFDKSVSIPHGEFVRGANTDYLAMSYLDTDTDKDQRLTRSDQQKLAVLDLSTLEMKKIALPGSLVEMQSILGRNDSFGFMISNDTDGNGRYDAGVEPLSVVNVDFRSGAVTPAIDDATIAMLQEQFDAMAKQMPAGMGVENYD